MKISKFTSTTHPFNKRIVDLTPTEKAQYARLVEVAP